MASGADRGGIDTGNPVVDFVVDAIRDVTGPKPRRPTPQDEALLREAGWQLGTNRSSGFVPGLVLPGRGAALQVWQSPTGQQYSLDAARRAAEQIRATPRPPAGGGGPSPADQLPPSSLPWWAAATAIPFPTKRERKRRGRRKRVAKLKTQAEQLLEAAKKAAKKYPKLERVLGRYGKYARGGAWWIGPMIAWDAGQWVGGQIYKRATDYYYRPKEKPPVRMPRPAVIQRPLLRPNVGVIRPTTVPSVYPETAVPAAAPNRRQSARRAAAPRSQAAVRQSGDPFPAIRVTARRIPQPRSQGRSQPARAPAPSARVPSILRSGLPLALAYLPQLTKRTAQPNPWQPPPQSPPSIGRLTSIEPQGLPFARTATEKCKCPKPKRKQSKQACRNPVVSRRKRTRDGRLFSTVTREIKCQA